MTILHFSHANGFPAACYRKMFAGLEDRFEIRAVNTIGHDPRYPVTDSWPHLIEELVDTVAGYGEPVLGVGHSLGGYLSVLAAHQRPELFRAIVLLDSPILVPWKGALLWLVKRLGLADRFTPAGVTRGRRATWPSVDEAYAHFRDKGPFRNFDPECLRDYVTLGTRPCADGVCLAFDTEIEYRIFRAFPHALAKGISELRVPAGLIYGRESSDARLMGLSTSLAYLRVASVEGGHLFPFERPAVAAGAIRDMAQALAPL